MMGVVLNINDVYLPTVAKATTKEAYPLLHKREHTMQSAVG